MHVRNLIAQDPQGWLAKLEADYSIHVVRDGDLVSLKYNQIESPMHDPLVQECRGMVVDVARGKVLAHPYNKFWNHGEPLAAPIDWSTARVLEKLDGSLMTLYWDDRTEEWSVASSGTPRASGHFGDSEGETFRDAFWRIWHDLGMQEPRERYRGIACFMFELCDQPNRIVVKHDKPRIVLHGGRWLDTGNEMQLAELRGFAEASNWELVKSLPIGSIDECLTAANEVDPLQCEGFIVVDAQFNRVKIKSPRYVALHHMKGEASELLTHFPEMAGAILPVHERLEALALDAVKAVNDNGALPRKEFAERVKHLPVSSLAFKLYGKQPEVTAVHAIMRAQTVQALERMLEAANG